MTLLLQIEIETANSKTTVKACNGAEVAELSVEKQDIASVNFQDRSCALSGRVWSAEGRACHLKQ